MILIGYLQLRVLTKYMHEICEINIFPLFYVKVLMEQPLQSKKRKRTNRKVPDTESADVEERVPRRKMITSPLNIIHTISKCVTQRYLEINKDTAQLWYNWLVTDMCP